MTSPQSLPKLQPLTVAGMMSGTSADGIDVAIVRIAPQSGRKARQPLTLQLLAHRGFPFSPSLRAAVLAAQDAQRTSTATLAQLNWRLGLAYSDAVKKTLATHPTLALDLVGCHGQTIYHQARPSSAFGKTFACTWQIGEPSLLAQSLGVPVVSNFRPADMAAGGQGAPLVSLLDRTLYRDSSKLRVLQNIGGIGNLTAVPPFDSNAPLSAFDTGPGNMVIDRLMTQLYDKPFDKAGRTAAQGQVIAPVLSELLRAPWVSTKPPKTTGREQFGDRYAAVLLAACRKHSKNPADAVATATALTAHSIATALERFVFPRYSASSTELIVSGGGAKNLTLLRTLRTLLEPYKTAVLTAEAPSLPTPMPVEAKEAVAFALLAYNTWHLRPANVPGATGASREVILGQVSYA